MPATPGNTGKKRLLCISPNTPVGKPGKELRYEVMECGSPDLRAVSDEHCIGVVSDGLGENNHSVPDGLVENNQNETASVQCDGFQKVSDGLVENNHTTEGGVGVVSSGKELPSINDFLMNRPVGCRSNSQCKSRKKKKSKGSKGGKQQVDENQKLISDLMKRDLKENDEN